MANYFGLAIGLLFLTPGQHALRAGTIFIPNSSFELPPIDFAGPEMGSWEKAPQPLWYVDPSGTFPWEALMGQFLNTTNGSANHIDNMDGSQGAYLFASPDVAIFQDYNTISGASTSASHPFNAQFEAGRSYTLTVGVLGGGGGMTNDATLEIALYFRDASNRVVTVGATTITNSTTLFPTNTHFTDFQVRLPFVRPTDPWAGKRIGIRIASTVGFDKMGGYWDLDNVRLADSGVPNDSFESPVIDFAGPWMDRWEKSPQPAWYVDPTGQFPWEALMGQFQNTTNGNPAHITNMEGNQAAYLFAYPDAAIFQDYTSPDHEFAAAYEPGKAYALTVGVIGGGGGMTNNATLELSLYYRDTNGSKVTVAATTITNSLDLFPTNTYFTDFQVRVPTVTTNDPWAGKHIGIQLSSTVGFDKMGGYWDVDNIRLTASPLTNSSFESPESDFAAPPMDGWQKAPQPSWYVDPSGTFPWEALMGQFANTTNGSLNHIDNMDGEQAAYLFASPDVTVFQECSSIGGADSTFEPGKSYTLTVGVIGGGGGMTNDATLELSVYYLDAANTRVKVASTVITNSATLFPTNTHFTDFAVQVPRVTAGDPWAGKRIGVQLASAVGFDKMGGYWDVDNVRLRSVEDPVLKNPRLVGGQFRFDLQSAPGQYALLATTNAALPSAQWDILGTYTNSTGSMSVSDPGPGLGRRFYRVRPSP